MSKIKYTYLILIGSLSGLWLLADPFFLSNLNFGAFRNTMMNYTGIIGIGVMSVAMILVIRPAFFETLLGGLDKSYRLHKWLGISGLVISIIHYLWAMVPKWMVGLGLMDRPQRGTPPEESVAILRFVQEQRGLAESIGEWAFYGALILMVLALVKWFPYRLFFKTHRFIAIAYLLLVFHSIVLMKSSYWNEMIGSIMLVLMAGGTVGAFISLFRNIGYRHRSVAEIEVLEMHPDNQVLTVILKMKKTWSGHQAGQFAFLTFNEQEGPHPYTISSSWNNDGRLRFMIKGLGDYTNQLPNLLKVGDEVKVEGPYGKFDFHGKKLQQVWIAGGIGITPFLSKMQALIKEPQHKQIDLFYSTDMPDESFIESIRDTAQLANVNLHLTVPQQDGYVNTHLITSLVPNWQGADIWFCGPNKFAQSIRDGFAKLGLANSDFHQEIFEMR